jgi:hypothetical protein
MSRSPSPLARRRASMRSTAWQASVPRLAPGSPGTARRPASIRSRLSAPALAGRGRRTGWAATWLADIEEQVTSGYVSNPWAGDLVLGHLIVLAELGFCPLTARAPRDPELFTGDWSKPRRSDHILARMGFAQALWRRARGTVMVYRGIALHDRPAATDSPGRRQSPLVSASFSREVADSHFRSPGAAAAALYRQPLAPEQIFMTFLETAAMNRQFPEAEAALLAEAWYLPSPVA